MNEVHRVVAKTLQFITKHPCVKSIWPVFTGSFVLQFNGRSRPVALSVSHFLQQQKVGNKTPVIAMYKVFENNKLTGG